MTKKVFNLNNTIPHSVSLVDPVVPIIFSTYPRIAVSIIAIILLSNSKPFFVDRAIWKQVTSIFSCFDLV
jgi:hypothetical protein